MRLTAKVPEPVALAIQRHARHKLLVAVASALLAGLAAGTAVFLLAATADRFIELPRGLRLAETILAAAALAAGVIVAGAALLGRRDPARAAGEIDRAVPGSRDLLRSTLDFVARDPAGPDAVNPYLLTTTAGSAADLAGRLDPAKLFGWKRLPQAALALLVLLVLAAGLSLWPYMQMELLVRRFLQPLGNHPRPSLTHIAVAAPLTQRVPQGTDVPVSVTLSGQVPSDAASTLHLVSASGPTQAIPMTPRPNQRFETSLRSLDAATEFYITAGDGRSATYRVAVDPRPKIAKLVAHYTYPGYTRLPRVDDEVRFGELRGVEGTRVRIEFESTLPVEESSVVYPDHKLKIQWDKSKTKGAFETRIDRDTTFNIRMVAAGGIENRDPAIRVRLVPDNPPTVSLLSVPENLSFYRDDVLNLGYRGVDDFGIAEVFVRSSKPSSIGAAGSREVSVNLTQMGAKEVTGELHLELRELVEEDAESVDVQLIMVDTKGQEAVSARLQLSLVSDTPERMLAELIDLQDKFFAALTATTNGLRGQSGRLGVLLDGMDDATKIEGKRAEMLDGMIRELGPLGVPNIAADLGPMRFFAVSEYPEPELRWTETCFSDALMLRRGSAYVQDLQAARAAASPRQAINAIKAAMEKSAADAQALQKAMAGVMLQTRLDMLQGLVDQFIDAESRLPAAGAGADVARLFRQRQDQRLAGLAKTAQETVAKMDPEAEPFAPLRAALSGLSDAAAPSTQPGDREAAVQASMKRLQAALRDAPAFDGRLGEALQQYQAAAPLPQRVQAAVDANNPGAAYGMLSSRMRLRRDDPQAGPAELLAVARLYEALASGDKARVAAAAGWANSVAPWIQASDLHHRLMSLRTRLRAWSMDSAIGRLPAQGVRLDQAWQSLREWALALTREHRAGLYAALDPAVQADLARLTAFLDLLAPTRGADALKQPRFRARLDELAGVVDQLIARVAPAVEAGSTQAAAQTNELLRDLATGLAAEKANFNTEIAGIATEVASAKRVDPSREKRVRGQMANPARLGFSASMGDRIASHAAALAAALDSREEVWSRTADPAAATDNTALTILFEYFAYLEEDFYDKAVAPYVEQVYGVHPYPGFVEAIGTYYTNLAPQIEKAGGWVQQVASGQAAALIKVDEFAQTLSRVNKATRLMETQRSIRQHTEFVAGLAGATDPVKRRAMFTALAADPAQASVYWERVVASLASLSADVEASVPTAGEWPGVDAAVAARWSAGVQNIRAMLPEAKPAPEEVKLVDDVVGGLPGMIERARVEKLAKATPAERDAAREDLSRWRGEIAGAIRGLEGKTAVPQVPTRPRARFVGRPRADLGDVQGRIIRSESRWTRRAAGAVRGSWVARAGALLPGVDPAVERRDVNWAAAQEGAVRRKSAAALSQRSRALGIESNGPDEQYLKMPRYLYDELQRASARPYPEQFKDPALKYMEGLLKDSR